MKPTTSRLMVRVLLSAVGAATLLGCDQRSENEVAIHNAARELKSSGAVLGSDSGAIADSRLREVAAMVQSAATNGTDAEKASASALLAQTILAQGEAAASQANQLQLNARNIMMRINSAAGEWAQRNAVAAAADAFDVSQDLAAIAASKAAKIKELATERARLVTVTQAVEALESESKAKLTSADAKITQYAEMTQTAAKMSATQAADTYEKANVLRREGDLLRAEAMKIQARADSQSPLIPEIGLLIDKLDKQIKNLDSTADSLQARVAATKADAQDARRAAEKVAAEIDDRIVELTKLRETELVPAFDNAISILRKAVTTSNAAATQSGGAGKIATGSAQLAVAEAQWAKASSARAYSSLLAALAVTTPKLPHADDYQAKSAAARTDAEEAIKAATESLESAKTAFESGGNRMQRPDLKERIEKLGQLLDQKAKNVVDGIWMDLKGPPPPAASPAAGSPDAGASAPGAADPELLAFLDTYLTAVKGKQIDQVLTMTYLPDPEVKQIVGLMGGMQSAILSADTACQAKFNQPIEKVMSSNPMLGMMFQQMGGSIKGQIAALENVKAADLAVTMNGSDRATIDVPGSPMPTECVKVDGAWMLDLGAQGAGVKAAAPMLKKVAPLVDVINAWTADVNAGKFADANAAAAEFSTKAMPALQGLMQGGPGGG